MSGANRRRALLLGLVEVIRPVEPLDEEARATMLATCHTVSTAGHVEGPDWLGQRERGCMGVEVILDQQHLRIISDKVLVSQHSLVEVCAIRTEQRNEGHLVFVGRCHVRRSRLAVVLDMMSKPDAEQLKDYILQRFLPVSARPSAPDATSSRMMSTASSITPATNPEQYPLTIHSNRPDNSVSQDVKRTPAHTSASAFRVVSRSVFSTSGLTEPPPIAPKPILHRAPAPVVTQLRKPLLNSMPGTAMLTTTPTVSARPVSKPMVSTQPVSILTVSNQSVTSPKVSTRPLSSPRVITPLVYITSVSTRPVSTSTISTRIVSTPKVTTRSVSNPKVSTPLVSIPSMYTTPISTSMESPSMTLITPASTSAVSSILSTKPGTVSTVSITRPSITVVTSLPMSVSSSLPSASIQPPSTQNRRMSIASCSSQDEESNINDKIKYSYLPGMQLREEQYSLFSIEKELCIFLENEHQYLSILERIKETRKILTSELQNLLGGVDRLFNFHKDLYQNLCQEFPSSSGIASAFLSRKDELDLYRYYIMNAPQVASQLKQQTEEGIRQHPTLEADIKSSWKRVHYYFMTFERLIKIVPAEEQELVQKVVNLLRETNRHGDSGILIDSIRGAPFSLHTLGTLLLHSLFTIKDSSSMLSSITKYHVLLFKEMIVIVMPKKEKYQYKDHLPLRQLNLLTQLNSDEATFTLELVQGGNKRRRKYTFRSATQEVKNAWVAEISHLHSKYEEEVERLRKLRCGYD